MASASDRPEPSSVEADVIQTLPNIAHAIEAWLFDGASDTHTAREVLSLPPFEKLKAQRDDALALAAAQNGGNRLASAEWTKTLLKLRDAQKERDAIVAAGDQWRARAEAQSLSLSEAREEIERLKRERDEALEALRPFGALADSYFHRYETRPGVFRESHQDDPDDRAVYGINRVEITTGHFRRARSVLANRKSEGV